MKKTLVIFASLLAISAFGCKKDKDKKGDEGKANPCAKNPCAKNPCATAKNPCAKNPCAKNPCAKNPCAKNPCNPCAAGKKADPTAHLPKDATANVVIAKVGHTEPKADDPVQVVFEGVEVKSAKIKDLKNLTGSTATIEINVMGPKSGDKGRDAHLIKDFFKAKATVKISKVKKDGDGYKAEAAIELHGITKTWPVTFKVEETKDDWVRVKGMHKFKRSDFDVGKDVKGPADEVDLMLQVTLKKS